MGDLAGGIGIGLEPAVGEQLVVGGMFRTDRLGVQVPESCGMLRGLVQVFCTMVEWVDFWAIRSNDLEPEQTCCVQFCTLGGTPLGRRMLEVDCTWVGELVETVGVDGDRLVVGDGSVAVAAE